MIMKFGAGVKLDVFYTMVPKNCDVTTIMSFVKLDVFYTMVTKNCDVTTITSL